MINYFVSFLFLYTGFIYVTMQFKNFLCLRFKDQDVYVMNLYWKESPPLFQSARAFANYFIYAIFPCSDFCFGR